MTLDYVNKIFFVTSCWNKRRVDNVKYHIYNLGLLNDNRVDIHYINKFEAFYKDSDISKVISKYLYHQKGENNENIKIINYFNNFINHYHIISESYFLNYDYIIVCEDDLYISNFPLFKELLYNIPDDTDFIQFHNKYDETNKTNNTLIKYNDYFYKVLDPNFYTLHCSLFSKKMISRIYQFYIDNIITYADKWMYGFSKEYFNDLNVYIPINKVLEDEHFPSQILLNDNY